ncbi:Uncharacterized protein YeaZ [Candidatus Moranella endobia PCVAL]|nr:tRNA (adenosine(37)-N6)-threonylcarbamoyltransferase complex dimerization subunit type 1 TsaB [Candidatus Moranella endobia]AGJ61476.1 Uncharacterized protein YeaZ [Candidatus Moranella endobia PCVAL]
MATHILAIDSTTAACSAALMLDNEVVLERFVVAPREHTQLILPMVDSLLAEADISLYSLDAIAFGRGPGSFTGVRISICIAQGLALGANLQLIGVSTLAALAEGAWRRTGICKVLTAIDARMGEVYWATYKRHDGVWLGEEHEKIVVPDVLAAISTDLTGCWATAGTGWQTYPTLLNHVGLKLVSGKTLFPSAQDILPLALHHYRHGNNHAVVLVEPTYLRNAVACKNSLDAPKLINGKLSASAN